MLSAGAVLLLVLFAPLLTGCDDESLTAPEVRNDLFESYVSLGNSITAGFQSNGIVDSTQQDSYASLLAKRMGTPFGTPSLAPPGCPPPVDDIFSASFGGGPSGCSPPRSSPLPTTLNNVAVPEAQVFDALSNMDPNAGGELPLTSANELTQFILGGRSQVEAASDVNPTFASVWLGNNDLLGAALAGVPDTTNGIPDDDLDNFPAPSTPPDLFEQQYRSVVDSLVNAGVKRGVLIAVANPTLVPNFTRGQAFFAGQSQINDYGQALAAQSSQFNWGQFEADPSCASRPGADIRVPLSHFLEEILGRALLGFTSTLNCDPSAVPEPILTPSEQAAVETRLNEYNDRIETIAQENNWAFVDGLNPTLQGFYQNDLVPLLPAPTPNSPTFGRYFSEDGVHPSSPTHRVVAHLIIRKLNSKYDDVQLEQISIPDEVRPLLP